MYGKSKATREARAISSQIGNKVVAVRKDVFMALDDYARKRQVPNYCKHDGLRDGPALCVCAHAIFMYLLQTHSRGELYSAERPPAANDMW